MLDSLPTATKRALLCLALAGGWTALAGTEAHAFQSTGQPAQQAAAEQETTRGWTYGVRGSFTFPLEDSLNFGPGGSGVAVFPFATDLEFEGEVGLQFLGTEKNGLPEGSLMMFPLRATLRVQMWRFAGAKPYVGGGAGVYFYNFSQDSAAKDQLNQQGIGTSVSIDTGLALHAAGGMEWERGRFHFGIDVKYVFGETDVLSTSVDTVTGNILRETTKLDMNSFWMAAGARLSF